MIQLPLLEVFDAAGVTWTSPSLGGNAERCKIDAVSTDTRELRAGSLFLALSGPRFDGANFAGAALDAGASAVLVQESSPEARAELVRLSELHQKPIAICPDTRSALGSIGRMIRRRSSAQAVAITGSCGKTSTKSVVAHMLRAADGASAATVVASPKSFNNFIGVPRTLMLTEDATEFMVLEVGTNGPGEIAGLAAIAEPDVALITTIGRAHLEGLCSVEGIADEKGALLASLDPSGGTATAVLNADCPMMPRLLERVPEGARVLTFGYRSPVHGEGAVPPSVCAANVRATPRGTEFQLFVEGALTPDVEIQGRDVVVPLLGDHAAVNVCASIAAVIALGGDLEAALGSIATLEAEPHRLQPTVAGGVLVIDDAYNANPQSMAAAIRTLMGVERSAASTETAAGVVSDQRSPQRVLVAGAMGEMGDCRLDLHREVGEMAGASGIDRLFLTGEPQDQDALAAMAEGAIAKGMAPGRVHLCGNVPGAIDALTASDVRLVRGDICLVKASRAVGLERVVEALTEHFSVDRAPMEGLADGTHRSLRRPLRPGAPT